jgi:hypothetical protein
MTHSSKIKKVKKNEKLRSCGTADSYDIKMEGRLVIA